jgi:hypothetical protein
MTHIVKMEAAPERRARLSLNLKTAFTAKGAKAQWMFLNFTLQKQSMASEFTLHKMVSR